MKQFCYKEFLKIAHQAAEDTVETVSAMLGFSALGLAIEEEKDYDWSDASETVGAYVNQSVFEKTIRFAINYKATYRTLKENVKRMLYPESCDIEEDAIYAIRMTVWHEVIHGFWQYIDDLLWNCPEIRNNVYAEKRNLGIVNEFRENEENTVEKAAYQFVNGYQEYPECEFLAGFQKYL